MSRTGPQSTPDFVQMITGVPSILMHAVWKAFPRVLPTRTLQRFIERVVVPSGMTVGEFMTRREAERHATSENHLLRGDLQAYANQRWPVAEYPELHADVPADIARPVIADGRLVDGQLLSALGPRLLDEQTTRKLFDAASYHGVANAMSATAVLGLALFMFGAKLPGLGNYGPAYREAVATISDREILATADRDFWSPKERADYVAEKRESMQSTAAWGSRFQSIIGGVSSLGALGLGLGGLGLFAFGLGGFLAFRPRNISGAVQQIVESDPLLTTESKESIVRYKYRIEQRAIERRAYGMQIETALDDKTPLISFGKGTGTIAFRGSLQGAMPGQTFGMTINDFHQHLGIVGGTGQGKSYLLKKIMRQMITSVHPGYSFGMYVTDGKGVLWQDAVAVAHEAGVPYRVIGPRDGHVGVDLFDGLPPHIISDVLGQVMSTGATGDGKFFEDMAVAITQAAVVIARAYELTPEGQATVQQTGELLYSPVGVYRLAMSVRDPGGALHSAISAICDAMERDPDALAGADGPELDAAIDLICLDIPQYPDATAGSFLAHITNSLGGFGTVAELRTRFGTGKAPKDQIIEIDRVWDPGYVTGVALSPIDYGNAARIANVMLTARLYHRGRQRNNADPTIGQKSKLAVIIDELPALSSPSTSEISHVGFAPVARSSGVMLIVGLQSPATLRSAMAESSGGSKADSMLDQFRSWIILQTESKSGGKNETLALMQGLAGKALRSYVRDHNQTESWMSALFEQGRLGSLDRIDPVAYTPEQIQRLVTAGSVSRIVVRTRSQFTPDWHFADSPAPSIHSSFDGQEKQKSVVWRADDKRDKYLGEGTHEADLVRLEDMTMFGRRHAFAYIQRAGHVRMDVIELAS